MAMSWTEDQKKVIELRNRNILVSAAAGSGKTAVLVERIIQMVADAEHPVDIDRLLVVTFTKAAAREMKERIHQAIDRLLEEQPENEHLQKQSALIHNAQITTIHSFCKYVIQNHFQAVSIDPAFRVAEEGELKLMRSDSVKEIIEEAHQQEDDEFRLFMECYASGKSDDSIAELILNLYEFSRSYPSPKKWMDECIAVYRAEDICDMEESSWMKVLMEDIHHYALQMSAELEQLVQICTEPGGPDMYMEALHSDLEFLKGVIAAKDYRESAKCFNSFTPARLSGKKSKDVIPGLRSMVKDARTQIKGIIQDIKDKYFFQSIEQMLEDVKGCYVNVKVLLELVEKFSVRYQEKKQDQNVLDFSDLEHYALRILSMETEEGFMPTQIAVEMAEGFEEILIDEYQDSNLVQETLLTSISREVLGDKGRKNIFMVGDVKQSIYRFRLARPELFMEKYDTYTLEDGDCQRIDLHKNFRSRAEVLSAVNCIFYQIMGKDLGKIEYNQEAALYPGTLYPEGDNPAFRDTEICLLITQVEEENAWDSANAMGEPEEISESKVELEAKAAALRIQQMIHKELVLDKRTGEYRTARYSDVVILLRTMTGWADTFVRVFSEQGIPAFAGSQTGYFSALEVQVVLNALRILDNPRQDIPLASVLLSPIGDLSAEELAVVKSVYKDLPLYEACLTYKENGRDEKILSKLKGFFTIINRIKRMLPYTPIHKVIWRLLDETGYGEYAAAMPGGEQRRANLEMLVEKAVDFEEGSYKGLFNFVRYIEQLKSYQVDYGEASIIGEHDDTVRIMSIHKSKGLEFPIVFVCGMGKKFNKQDSRSKVILHPELGIGTDFIDPKVRIKAVTLPKRAIQKQTLLENLGEELRVLYVALTRAKEKLIIMGTAEHLDRLLGKWAMTGQQEEWKLPFYKLSQASSFMELILPAMLRHPAFQDILEEYGMQSDPLTKAGGIWKDTEIPPIRIIQITPDELMRQGKEKELKGAITKEILSGWDTEKIYNQELYELFHKNFFTEYPHPSAKDIMVKLTVSELKRRGQNVDEGYSASYFKEPDIVPYIPRFIQERETLKGAARGTAYHKFLEHLDFSRVSSVDEIKSQLEDLEERKILTPQMKEVIYPYSIYRFANSALARRIQEAASHGRLYQEQQFVISIPASDIDTSWSCEEEVLVQGIIDAYFYEDGEIVLLDYKTDYIKEGEEQKLVSRYGEQLRYYGRAIEQITGERVKEKLIYSFSLHKWLCI